MKQKAIVSACTLLGSLATYYYAKTIGKDVVPYVMIGGFIGGMLGEFFTKEKE